MIITHKITMALDRRGVTPIIDAVQGDNNTRAVEIELTCCQQPWAIPEGVIGMIRFRKPDGTGGSYDTLPNGAAAVTVKDNALIAILAPQVLTAAGNVEAQVELIDQDKHLATFTFSVEVQADPSVGAMNSEDYFNLIQYVTKEIDQALESAKESGKFDGADGKDGNDGVSPTVSVSAITGGNRVTITDANGTKTFDVLNGKDGEDGSGSSVTLDTTLSQPGQAADAQAVGLALTQFEQTAGQMFQEVIEAIPAVDATLSNSGQAADAKAVGELFAQFEQSASQMVQQVVAAIPTEAQINALIDAYLSEALGGEY